MDDSHRAARYNSFRAVRQFERALISFRENYQEVPTSSTSGRGIVKVIKTIIYSPDTGKIRYEKPKKEKF